MPRNRREGPCRFRVNARPEASFRRKSGIRSTVFRKGKDCVALGSGVVPTRFGGRAWEYCPSSTVPDRVTHLFHRLLDVLFFNSAPPGLQAASTPELSASPPGHLAGNANVDFLNRPSQRLLPGGAAILHNPHRTRRTCRDSARTRSLACCSTALLRSGAVLWYCLGVCLTFA